MTQPPLSQAIAALERDLGVELLYRQPRGVTLTDAGKLLARDGQALFEWQNRIVKNVRNTGQGLKGSLSLAATPATWWFQLPGLLKLCHDQLPEVELTFADVPPVEALTKVIDRRAHIGFIATAAPEIVAKNYPDLAVHSLTSMPMVLAIPDTLAVEAEASIHDFRDMPWIIPAKVPGFPGPIEIFNQLWQSCQENTPERWEVSTLQSAIPLVADGMGVALMPEAVEHHVSPRVRTVRIREGVAPLHSAVTWRNDARLDGALAAFLKLLFPEGQNVGT